MILADHLVHHNILLPYNHIHRIHRQLVSMLCLCISKVYIHIQKTDNQIQRDLDINTHNSYSTQTKRNQSSLGRLPHCRDSSLSKPKLGNLVLNIENLKVS
jgi:hypothetical protein